MPISAYLANLRRSIGHDLVLMPSVAVLITDESGRLLLVRQTDTAKWATVGGAVDPDESPREAAVREAREETGVDVELDGVVDVLGGPRFRITYPNGDQVSYVSTVYRAGILRGEPRPDYGETDAVAWFTREQLASADLSEFARETFCALGWRAERA